MKIYLCTIFNHWKSWLAYFFEKKLKQFKPNLMFIYNQKTTFLLYEIFISTEWVQQYSLRAFICSNVFYFWPKIICHGIWQHWTNRLYQGFRLKFGNNSVMIIFVSFFTILWATVFGVARPLSEIALSQNRTTRANLNLSYYTLGIIKG